MLLVMLARVLDDVRSPHPPSIIATLTLTLLTLTLTPSSHISMTL